MTDREFRRLSRAELIEIIYELQRQNQQMERQLYEAQCLLNERTLRLSNAGSIAQAALALNGVFEAAQAAADQYLLSVRTLAEQMPQAGDMPDAADALEEHAAAETAADADEEPQAQEAQCV